MRPALLIATKGWDIESWVARIKARLPDHSVIATDRDGVFSGSDASLANVSYLLAWKPRQDVVDRLPNLEAIFSLGAGVDHLLELERPPDVPIARIVDDDLTRRMGEYVAWQALHHLRQATHYIEAQAGHSWRPRKQAAAEAVTVGIMGLGVMGVHSADLLRRIGFNVRGWSRSPKKVPGVETFHGGAEVDAFLAQTDILVVLLPLTPDTRGLIDKRLLSKLRRNGSLGGPVLIGAGRGGTHVEADIVEALRDGTLKAASLDVFEVEPLPADSPLWDLPNVVITPHVAADSDADALSGQIADQVLAFERGEPLRNLVNRERGY